MDKKIKIVFKRNYLSILKRVLEYSKYDDSITDKKQIQNIKIAAMSMPEEYYENPSLTLYPDELETMKSCIDRFGIGGVIRNEINLAHSWITKGGVQMGNGTQIKIITL